MTRAAFLYGPPSGRFACIPAPCPATLVLILLFFAIQPAAAGTPATDPEGALYLVTWRLDWPGGGRQGTACWVAGPDGVLRLEILPGPQEAASGSRLLLDQVGDGYTLVLVGDRDGTFNAWGQEWRPVPAAATGWVGWLCGVLQGENPAAAARSRGLLSLPVAAEACGPRPRFLDHRGDAENQPAVRLQLPDLALLVAEGEPDEPPAHAAPPAFRQRLTRRAAGRGGAQEVLVLTPLVNRDTWSWNLTSSRKPGRLRVGPATVWATGPVGLEVFAPLWPLGQLLETGDKISGTRQDSVR
jgi:hypothetical protein